MKYLKIWLSFFELLEELSDEEAGRLFHAMKEYAETGEEPHLAGNERFLWPCARQNVRNAREEYDRLKSNGSRGGRPRKTVKEQPQTVETTSPVTDNLTQARKPIREKASSDREKTASAGSMEKAREADQDEDYAGAEKTAKTVREEEFSGAEKATEDVWEKGFRSAEKVMEAIREKDFAGAERMAEAVRNAVSEPAPVPSASAPVPAARSVSDLSVPSVSASDSSADVVPSRDVIPSGTAALTVRKGDQEALLEKARRDLSGLTDSHVIGLKAYGQLLGEDLVAYAIDQTVAHGSRAWAYTEKVVCGYIQKNIGSVAEAEAEEEKRRASRYGASAGKAPTPAVRPPKTVSAQRYTQRQYEEKELEERLGVLDIYRPEYSSEF